MQSAHASSREVQSRTKLIQKLNPDTHALTLEALELSKPPMLSFLETVQLPEFYLNLKPGDSVLDEDPFFLNAQTWQKSKNSYDFKTAVSNNLEYETTQRSNGMQIHVSGAGVDATLNLNVDLRAVLQTEAYIFLVPNQASFFADKKAGEGLFFISKIEFQKAMDAQVSVPVNFFPMPAGQWHAIDEIFEMQNVDALFVRNGSGVASMILYPDLDQIAKAQRNNLIIANAIATEDLAKKSKNGSLPASEKQKIKEGLENYFDALKNAKSANDLQSVFSSMQKLQQAMNIKPLPNSTAGFGSVVLDRKTYKKVALNHKKFSFIHEAYADEEKPKLTPEQLKALDDNHQELIDRMTQVGMILGATLVVAVLLKYFAFEDHFIKKRAEKYNDIMSRVNDPIQRSKLEQWYDNTYVGKAVAGAYRSFAMSPLATSIRFAQLEVNEVLDVYVHALTTLAQFPVLTVGHTIMNSVDQYLPKVFASSNSWIRQLMNKTVLKSVQNNSRIPVNANTFWKGVVILGGTDTAFVVTQLYHVVPWAAHNIAESVPALAPRVNEAFKVGDPLTEQFNRNDVIRNSSGYAVGGAMGVSQDMRLKVNQIVAGQVETQMRREGFDLSTASAQEERQRRVDQLAETQMKRVGLPSIKEFLFDYRLIIDSAYRLLGYRQFVNTPGNNYVGQARTGLWGPTFKKSIDKLTKESNAGSSKAREALIILLKAQDESHFLEASIKALVSSGVPRGKNLQDAVIGWIVKMREAMDHYYEILKWQIALTAEKPNLAEVKELSSPWFKYFSEPGVEYANETIRKSFFEYLGEKQEPVTMPEGFFEKRQKNKVVKATQQAFEKEFGIAFTEGASEAQKIWWRSTFRKEYIAMLGISPDYIENPVLADEVLKVANSTADKYTQSDEFLKTIKNKNFITKQTEIAAEYAKAEAATYVEKTVWSGSISRLDPAQPGATQKIRQLSLFRGQNFFGKIGTRVLRFVDALFAESEYTTGFSQALYRKVPLVYDLWQGMKYSLQNAPMNLTVAWGWSQLFWGADISWSNYLYVTFFTGFTISGPAFMVGRIFEHQAWRPIQNVVLMVALATVHSWATFWGSIPDYIFARDFAAHFPQIVGGTALAIGSALGIEYYREKRARAIMKNLDEGDVQRPKSLGIIDWCKNLVTRAPK